MFYHHSGKVVLKDLQPFVDRGRARVLPVPPGNWRWIMGSVCSPSAPRRAGASGKSEGRRDPLAGDLILRSELDNGHVLLVSLDGNPIATSPGCCFQVVSGGTPAGCHGGRRERDWKITDIGRDPWQVQAAGRGRIGATDRLSIQPLNFNGIRGYPP